MCYDVARQRTTTSETKQQAAQPKRAMLTTKRKNKKQLKNRIEKGVPSTSQPNHL
jgi:hypothetical protein